MALIFIIAGARAMIPLSICSVQLSFMVAPLERMMLEEKHF
jgi:hypothetical protein